MPEGASSSDGWTGILYEPVETDVWNYDIRRVEWVKAKASKLICMSYNRRLRHKDGGVEGFIK